jgi:hypothetical protein
LWLLLLRTPGRLTPRDLLYLLSSVRKLSARARSDRSPIQLRLFIRLTQLSGRALLGSVSPAQEEGKQDEGDASD